MSHLFIGFYELCDRKVVELWYICMEYHWEIPIMIAHYDLPTGHHLVPQGGDDQVMIQLIRSFLVYSLNHHLIITSSQHK